MVVPSAWYSRSRGGGVLASGVANPLARSPLSGVIKSRNRRSHVTKLALRCTWTRPCAISSHTPARVGDVRSRNGFRTPASRPTWVARRHARTCMHRHPPDNACSSTERHHLPSTACCRSTVLLPALGEWLTELGSCAHRALFAGFSSPPPRRRALGSHFDLHLKHVERGSRDEAAGECCRGIAREGLALGVSPRPMTCAAPRAPCPTQV